MNKRTHNRFLTVFCSVMLVLVLTSTLSNSAIASPLVITQPSTTKVSGLVKITVTASSPVSWFNLMVDGVWIASNPSAPALSYNFTWDSSQALSAQITNNIFYNVGSDQDSYVCADPASRTSLQVTANDHLVPGGSPGTYCGNAPHFTLDPLFAKAAGLDFHLRSNSPVIDQGSTLPQVTNDFDGKPRPQGAGYDVGAFEYH